MGADDKIVQGAAPAAGYIAPDLEEEEDEDEEEKEEQEEDDRFKKATSTQGNNEMEAGHESYVDDSQDGHIEGEALEGIHKAESEVESGEEEEEEGSGDNMSGDDDEEEASGEEDDEEVSSEEDDEEASSEEEDEEVSSEEDEDDEEASSEGDEEEDEEEGDDEGEGEEDDEGDEGDEEDESDEEEIKAKRELKKKSVTSKKSKPGFEAKVPAATTPPPISVPVTTVEVAKGQGQSIMQIRETQDPKNISNKASPVSSKQKLRKIKADKKGGKQGKQANGAVDGEAKKNVNVQKIKTPTIGKSESAVTMAYPVHMTSAHLEKMLTEKTSTKVVVAPDQARTVSKILYQTLFFLPKDVEVEDSPVFTQIGPMPDEYNASNVKMDDLNVRVERMFVDGDDARKVNCLKYPMMTKELLITAKRTRVASDNVKVTTVKELGERIAKDHHIVEDGDTDVARVTKTDEHKLVLDRPPTDGVFILAENGEIVGNTAVLQERVAVTTDVPDDLWGLGEFIRHHSPTKTFLGDIKAAKKKPSKKNKYEDVLLTASTSHIDPVVGFALPFGIFHDNGMYEGHMAKLVRSKGQKRGAHYIHIAVNREKFQDIASNESKIPNCDTSFREYFTGCGFGDMGELMYLPVVFTRSRKSIAALNWFFGPGNLPLIPVKNSVRINVVERTNTGKTLRTVTEEHPILPAPVYSSVVNAIPDDIITGEGDTQERFMVDYMETLKSQHGDNFIFDKKDTSCSKKSLLCYQYDLAAANHYEVGEAYNGEPLFTGKQCICVEHMRCGNALVETKLNPLCTAVRSWHLGIANEVKAPAVHRHPHANDHLDETMEQENVDKSKGDANEKEHEEVDGKSNDEKADTPKKKKKKPKRSHVDDDGTSPVSPSKKAKKNDQTKPRESKAAEDSNGISNGALKRKKGDIKDTPEKKLKKAPPTTTTTTIKQTDEQQQQLVEPMNTAATAITTTVTTTTSEPSNMVHALEREINRIEVAMDGLSRTKSALCAMMKAAAEGKQVVPQ